LQELKEIRKHLAQISRTLLEIRKEPAWKREVVGATDPDGPGVLKGKRKMMKPAACLAVVLLASACGGDRPRTPAGPTTPTVPAVSGFTLSGSVSESRPAGPPLAGATVRATPGTAVQTDSEGRYEIPNLSGTVSVTVAATHYVVPEAVEVTMDADRTVDFTLEHSGTPPFGGTAFISPDVIDSNDPSALMGVSYAGRGTRSIFDQRVDAVVSINAYVFDARYSWGTMEFWVNPEFGSADAARGEVDAYAGPLGRLPFALMTSAERVVVNAGEEPFLGGSGGFVIHTGNGQGLIGDGFLEEVLFHEAGHVSLDEEHYAAPAWVAAQEADGVFISTYAQDHPQREDIAESIVAYFALRYRAGRLSAATQAAIATAIPNRLIYFDEQGFDMSPYRVTAAAPSLGLAAPQRTWRVFEGPPARRRR